MAQFKLPAATSVVDYLNSNKQDSSYGARGKLYESAGLSKRLGEFTGSSSQNLALLDFLKAKAPVPATPASSLVTTAKTSTPQTAGVATSPAPAGGIDFSKISVSPPAATAPSSASLLTRVPQGAPAPDFSKLTVAPPPQPAAPATTALSTIAPSTPAPASPGTAAPTETVTETLSYNTLYPGATDPAERDLVNEFLTSEEGKLLLEKRELGELSEQMASAEAKRQLEERYQSDRATLEANLAKNGLAFSGIRNTQLKALADNLAASELNLDRKLASKLLDSNVNLREGILKGVEELIKKAAEKDKEAIQQLNSVGLAVVNGQLVPTLAAQNAERSEANRVADNLRADAQFALSERRLQLAEESAQRAEDRFLQLYGEEKRNVFDFARQLFELNPDATTAEYRAAMLEYNPDASSAEIDAAMNLQGIPKALQPNLVGAYVASSFDSPGILSRLKRGNDTEKALAAAKEKAKQALKASGGVIVVDKGGKTSTYNVTTDQLNTLVQMVDTISIDDVKTLKSAMEAEK